MDLRIILVSKLNIHTYKYRQECDMYTYIRLGVINLLESKEIRILFLALTLGNHTHLSGIQE